MTSRPIDPAAVSQMQGGGMLKLTLLLVASLSIMSGATIAPSLPAIEAAYAGNPNAALLTRLVLTLPALFVALASPIVGRLGDRMGRTKLLIGALVLYAAAGSSGLYADSLPGLLIGRALLGIAVAGVMTLGTALAGDYFSGAERDRFMGLQQAFMGLGGLVFLTAAGYLADLDWRYPFVIYLFAAAILPLAARTLREPARHEAEAPGQGRASAVPAGSIAALCLLIFILSSTFYLIPAQLPFHMPKLGFDAPSEAGLAVALMTLFSATGSLSYGAIRRFASPFTVFAAGIVIAASGLVTLGFAASFPIILTGVALTGLGMGLSIPNILSLAMALSPPSARARVSGAIAACLFIGQFVSPFWSQPLIAAWGYEGAFWAGAGFLCLGLIPGLLAARTPVSHM